MFADREQQSGKMPRLDKASSRDCVASRLTKLLLGRRRMIIANLFAIYAEPLLMPHSHNSQELIRLAEADH